MSSRYSAGAAHQRDLRTQLFAQPSRTASPLERTASPYEKTPVAKHNESYLSSLEAQNNEEMDSMNQKVAMLKNLGIKMGTEINKSIKLNEDITNSFEKGKVTLKKTFNQMVIMSQRAGITWRMWLVVFGVVGLWFFWVWIT